MSQMFRIFLWICIAMSSSGCLQTENSNSLDMYAGAEGARGILTSRCASCHDYIQLSDQELIDQGLVVAGDPEASQIFFRLVGSSGTGGPKNMPQGGALTASEVEQIRVWILEL